MNKLGNIHCMHGRLINNVIADTKGQSNDINSLRDSCLVFTAASLIRGHPYTQRQYYCQQSLCYICKVGMM